MALRGVNVRRCLCGKLYLRFNNYERQSAFISGLNSDSISHYDAALIAPESL